MRKHEISQETLKLIACVTMLLDHIGAVIWPSLGLRIVGRLAFPIYCFLLAEGIHYTNNPKKYGLRLFLAAVLAELPFDLMLFGRITWQYQSVMGTLLLGFLYGIGTRNLRSFGLRVLLVFPFMAIAERFCTDYGSWGVAMTALFILTRQLPNRMPIQLFGLLVICYLIGGMTISFGPIQLPIELFAVFALIPIGCYSGEKSTDNVWIQRVFYLFYPAHMAVLWLIREF